MERSTFRLKIMRAGRHSTTPLSAWSGYNNKNRAHGSRVMELPEVADNSPRVASEKQHGTESENTCNFPIFDTFGRYIWKCYSSKKQAFRNTKIGTRSAKGLYYRRKSPPTSGILYVWRKHVRLYLSSEYTLLTVHIGERLHVFSDNFHSL